MNEIKLSQVNQKYIENRTLNQTNNVKNNTPAPIKDNGLKQDTFVNSHKKEIVIGGVLGSIALTLGLGTLAYKGKLGSKAQELTQNIISKFKKSAPKAGDIEVPKAAKAEPKAPTKVETTAIELEPNKLFEEVELEPIEDFNLKEAKSIDVSDNFELAEIEPFELKETKLEQITDEVAEKVEVPEKLSTDNPIEKVESKAQPEIKEAEIKEAPTKETPSEVNSEVKTEAKSEAKSEAPAETKTGTKAETKEEPKIESKEEPKAEKASEPKEEPEISYPLGDYNNPIEGEKINIAKTDSTQTVVYKYKRNDGKWETVEITLDSNKGKEPLKYTPRGDFSSDSRANYRLRNWQYNPKMEDWNLESWKRRYNKELTYITEDLGYKPTFEEYCEIRKNYEIQETLKKQYTYMSQAPVNTEEHFLYRGITTGNHTFEKRKAYDSLLENAKIGDVIVPDWNVTCTSCYPEYALSYGTNGFMRIKTPVGAQLGAKGGHSEVNLPSMAKLKLTNKQQVGKLTIYDFDYVMPDLSDIDKAVKQTMTEHNIPYCEKELYL